MRRYWEIDQTFAQPSESLLKKNLKESVKKQKEKELTQIKKIEQNIKENLVLSIVKEYSQ